MRNRTAGPRMAFALGAALAGLGALAALAASAVPGIAVQATGGTERHSQFADEQVGLKLLGQFGGSSAAVALDERMAYVGYGPRVELLDVSNPELPIRRGQTPPLPGLILDLVAEYGFLYVAWGHEYGPRLVPDGGVAVMDVSDPSAPRQLAALDEPLAVNGIAKVGDLLYLAEGGQNLGTLVILDVSEPARPTQVGRVAAPGALKALGIAGDLALVLGHRGDTPTQLWQFEVGDPAKPVRRTGGLDGLGASDVRGNGRHVAVVVQRRVDVYGPGRPAPLRTASLDYTVGLQNPFSVAAAGDFLAVVDTSTASLNLFALGSDGTASSLGSLRDLPGGIRQVPMGRPAVDHGALLWLDRVSRQALVAAGVGSTAPIVGSVPEMLDEVEALAVRDGRVFVPWTDRLGVLDARSPGTIRPSRLDVFPEGVRILRDLTADGDRLYGLAGGTRAGLLIYSLARPEAPTLDGRLVEPKVYKGIAVAGGQASIGGQPGVQVVDVTVPARPRAVGIEAAPDNFVITQLAAADGRVLVASHSGFRVLDVTTAPDIRRLALLPSEQSELNTVAAAGDLAAVGGQDLNTEGFIQLLDLSNPRDPSVVATLPEPAASPVTALLLAGERLVVGSGNGLTVLDASDPYDPQLLARARTADQVMRLAIEGDRLYAADRYGGVWVFAATGLGLTVPTPTASATTTATASLTPPIVPSITPTGMPTEMATPAPVHLPWLER